MLLKDKTIVILVEDLYQELEVWYPLLRFREEGAKVIVAGTGAKTYKSKLGYEVAADTDAGKVDPKTIDAVVIPGGWAPDRMRCHPEPVKLTRDAFRLGKCVAAICHAGSMLVSADVLKGRTATSYVAVRDDMIHAGAKWVDREVVRDGNLITARKPDDLPAFCREIIAFLTENKQSSVSSLQSSGKNKKKKRFNHV